MNDTYLDFNFRSNIISELGNDDFELTDLVIKNARENNLKNISLNIPREKLVVITGLSGSGKSSLAFDTIYAEGQRRYIDCLSSYAKQYMGMLKKPDVDSIEGLSPAISIEQKTLNHNPRSTVGTTTEIYDYLRLLFAKVGLQYCVDCNVPVVKHTSQQIISKILNIYHNKSLLILAPLVYARKGEYNDLFINLISQGFTKVRIDGRVQSLDINMHLARYKNHDIELVVDKCLIDEEHLKRLEASVELALKRSNGTLMVIEDSEKIYVDTIKNSYDVQIFSINYACPKCNKSYRPLTPSMFSFNSSYGACSKCNGIGKVEDFDEKLLIPNKSISVVDGAIKFLGKKQKTWMWSQLTNYATEYHLPLDIPLQDLSDEQYNVLIWGPNEYLSKHSNFLGFIPNLRLLYDEAYSTTQQKELSGYRKIEICSECMGSRLKPESLAVRVHNYSMNDIVTQDIIGCKELIIELEKKFNATESTITNLITKEIKDRLHFLINVGLPYLSLNRTVTTLSGGEAQRIRLASQIGSQLVGITYVLDEPSIGLHQHDNNKLIDSLAELRDMGNSVIVVEHDKTMIKRSDFIVDIGPNAGLQGGEILFATDTNKINKLSSNVKKRSLTYQYINNVKNIALPTEYRPINPKNTIVLTGASGNNLKNVTLNIPLGLFICITGMSGSGKSTLINDTLFPILSSTLHRSSLIPLKYEKIEGIENIDKVIEIDQSPIGRSPRSNPATYTKMFDFIRTYYSELPESLVRGYQPGRFSFNLSGGRCEECEGAGIKKLEMSFLPDVYVTCDMCNGKRYNQETLQVKFKGKSIADVLDMTVAEAAVFFENIPRLKDKLSVMNEVGLGYIKLGQQAPTLSGGEAQRVKLATELSRPSTGRTLFLLDEPTTGLHFEDINVLLTLLQKLVNKGNTIVVIEHNLDVIKCADWIIDLGPEGGNKGGYIIAEGNPKQIAANPNSITGRYLKEEL